MNRILGWTSVAVLALAGCGGATPAGGGGDDTETAQAGLVSFATCAELETYIKDTAVLQMRESLDGNAYWYGRGGVDYGAPEAANDAESTSGTGSQASPDHSETNTQVAGVDEADFVKTDGTRVFYLVGRRLMVLKSWPAAATALSSTTQIEGYPIEMFLSEADQALVVFSSVPAWTYDPSVPAPANPMTWDYWYWYSDATKVTVFDVSTDTPALKNEYYLGGYYVSSRRIGSVVRMVASGALRWPELKWWLDTWSEDEIANEMALEQLKADNEAKIRAQPLAQWLPKSYVVIDGQKVDVSSDCTRFHKPTVGARLGLATVSTFDLANPDNLDTSAVIAEVGEVYANTENLYIATPQWWWGWWFNGGSSDQQQTWLHKFSLTDPARVSYLGSGSVPGTIIDQFSMDESQGYLRVATTLTQWDENWNRSTENRVYVLGSGAGELHLVGATAPIAPGESIYSSRFYGDKGFVVTYRQIDPLFTLDLSDPANPVVVGELTLPGYSSYIHLLDANHLLTIGEDTATTSTGSEVRNGLQLQIFDVSDLANPRLTAKTVVGTRYGYSEAMWDHKAFNYFAKTGMLAIPFTDWVPSATDYWGSFVSQLKLFHVDAAGAVTPMGEIDHKDVYQGWNQQDWYWWYEPYIRRSVQIENFVYSFSYAGVKVNDIAQPSVPVATVPVPPETYGESY